MGSTAPRYGTKSSKIRVAAESTEPLPVLQLRDWPLRTSPVRSGILALVFITLAGMIGWGASSWPLMIFAAIVFFVVTWRVWIPISFELDVRGIQQIVLRSRWFIGWSRIARYRVDEHGVLLLNDAEAFPMSALNGLYIRGGGRQEELLRLVEFYCNRDSDESAVTVDM